MPNTEHELIQVAEHALNNAIRVDSIKYLRLRVKELMAERYKLEGELKALENKLRQIREISA